MEFKDTQDGYQFLYPFGWQEIGVEGQDVVYKDVIEPLESVSVNMVRRAGAALAELAGAAACSWAAESQQERAAVAGAWAAWPGAGAWAAACPRTGPRNTRLIRRPGYRQGQSSPRELDPARSSLRRGAAGAHRQGRCHRVWAAGGRGADPGRQGAHRAQPGGQDHRGSRGRPPSGRAGGKGGRAVAGRAQERRSAGPAPKEEGPCCGTGME